MRFTVYQTTRQGGREKNEDRMGYSYTRHAGLFALADGMGGHPEGEVAAQLALQTLAGRFQRECKPRLAEPLSFLQEAVVAGHHQLQRYGERKGMHDTPRTTLVACVLQGRLAYWAHCGDSRLYLVRQGRLLSRTRDHSYAELQEQNPAARPERFNRNVLFTCLGSPGLPVVDTAGPHPLQAGDRFLLCSDGLWGNLPDELITDAIARAEIGVAVPELVELALRHGGSRCDNVTALAVEWESAEDDDAEPALIDHPLDADASRTDASLADAFATTIRPTLGSPEPAVDEAEVERSIRSVNEAIRRAASLPRKP